MKAIAFVVNSLCVIIAASGAVAANHAPIEPGLIDCDVGKVALFDDTKSKDGHYAIGWTIRVLGKNAKPVDWSLWTHDDHTGAMRENYIYNSNNDPHFPYELVNYAVDLRRKTTLELASPFSFHPGLNRNSLNTYWSSDSGTPGYGLVQRQSRFATDNLWLIKTGKSGMSATNILKPLKQAVQELLRVKMPLNLDDFAISFPKSDWDDEDFHPIFLERTVEIPFTADLPKTPFDRVIGTVTLNLPEGTMVKIASDTPRDDPFHDDPRLAMADRELNAIYATLQKNLDPAGRTALKKEQQQWIAKRNSYAGVMDFPLIGDAQDPSPVRRTRNELLLKSTTQRVGELKSRVKAQKE